MPDEPDVAEPDNWPAPQMVGMREFREHQAEFLYEAKAGASFLLTSRGEVVAQLGPPPAAHRARRAPGALKGRISMAPDFDELPADMIAAMEAGLEDPA